MRLRARLFLFFSLLSLLLLSVVGGIAYRLASTATREELDQEADAAVARAEAYLQWQGREICTSLRSLARDPVLRERLAGVASGKLDPQVPEVVALASEVAAGVALDLFEIVDSSGTVLSSAHWRAYYGKRRGRAVVVAQRGAGAVVERVRLRESSPFALLCSIPLTVGEGTFYAFGGRLLEGENLTELERLFDLKAFLIPLNAKTASKGGLTPPGGTSGIASPSPEAHLLREIPLPSAGERPVAKLVIGVSKARLDRLSQSLREALIYGAAAALLVSWLGAWALARRITRPLELLTRGVRRVASGDFTQPIPGGGPDELGELVESFNRMTADLRESRSAAARLERIAAWQEVARRIAHEIKNALSPIQLSVENIQRSYRKDSRDFERTLSRATETVRDEVEGLKAMVDEFSQLARMRPPSPVRHDVVGTAHRAVGLYRGLRPSVQVTFHGPSGPLEAEADPDQIARALGNLLANAIEACAEGGSVQVSVRACGPRGTEGAGWVAMEVRDDGRGLGAEELERVFEPYYTTKAEGTGLGLAIALKIASDHGGTIVARGQKGRGCTFTLVIPRHVKATREGSDESEGDRPRC